MKNQKSRRINRKQTKRKTIKRKTIKRKTIKRKTIKRKQNKKIVYNQKKMYGGNFNTDEENRLNQFLKNKYGFNEEDLKKVMKILAIGSTCFKGEGFGQLIEQINAYPEREEFMDWLNDKTNDGYEHVAYLCDDTDIEDDDDDDNF